MMPRKGLSPRELVLERTSHASFPREIIWTTRPRAACAVGEPQCPTRFPAPHSLSHVEFALNLSLNLILFTKKGTRTHPTNGTDCMGAVAGMGARVRRFNFPSMEIDRENNVAARPEAPRRLPGRCIRHAQPFLRGEGATRSSCKDEWNVRGMVVPGTGTCGGVVVCGGDPITQLSSVEVNAWDKAFSSRCIGCARKVAAGVGPWAERASAHAEVVLCVWSSPSVECPFRFSMAVATWVTVRADTKNQIPRCVRVRPKTNASLPAEYASIPFGAVHEQALLVSPAAEPCAYDKELLEAGMMVQ